MKLIVLGISALTSLLGVNILGGFHFAAIHSTASPAAVLVLLGMCMPFFGLLTTTVVRQKSHSMYRALVTVAWDASYLAGGEVLDVSAIFPNRCFGAIPIASTVNDYTWLSMYVQAASQAPATGVIQKYESTTGAPIALVEVPNTTNISAADGETYEIIGD